MAKINKSQIIALRTAAGKVFDPCTCKRENDEVCEFHHWLARNFDGIASTSDLDSRQARQAIDILRKQCGYVEARPALPASGKNTRRATGTGTKGSSANRLTPNQAEKINGLAELLGWDPDGKQMHGFIKRQTGQKMAVSWLRNYQASKVIIGLQRIIAGGDQSLYKFLNDLTSEEMKKAGVQETLGTIKRRLAE